MKSFSKHFWLIVGTFLLLTSIDCSRAIPQKIELTVSAAASLREAFQNIGAQFEARTHTPVTFNFGASGALQKQIEAAAPVDIFASAGQMQMNALAQQGLIVPETRRDFARNSLVLIVTTDHPPALQSFADLGAAKTLKLALGNPKTVPAGQYAEQALTRLGLWQQLQPRIIFAEDVRQVLDYVARGEVEAGLVYASDVRAAAGKVRSLVTAPSDSYDPILYPLAVIKTSPQQQAARALCDFISSDEGQTILASAGFERVSR